jgi:hypothetical protein
MKNKHEHEKSDFQMGQEGTGKVKCGPLGKMATPFQYATRQQLVGHDRLTERSQKLD